jgi:hypothetical protein
MLWYDLLLLSFKHNLALDLSTRRFAKFATTVAGMYRITVARFLGAFVTNVEGTLLK